jgi:hypothetical protein
MGLNLGRLLKDLGSAGGTYFKRQKKARKAKRESQDLIASNVDLAQEQVDRDYGQSALADLTADPVMRAAQMDTLGRYDQLSREGYSDLDRQAIDQSLMSARRDEQAQRQAAMAAAQRRGDTSGGNALMASLVAQQGGANRAAQDTTDIALEGRNRALQSLGAYGNMAGQMRSQQFGEQAQVGGAVDNFNMWASGMRQNAVSNLANANLGQAQNLNNIAAQMEATPNLDAGLNAYTTYLGVGPVAGGSQPAAAPTPSPYASAAPSVGTGHEVTSHARTAAPTGRTAQRRGGFGGAYG